MTRLILFLSAMALTAFSFGQKKIRSATPDLKTLPKEIQYDGKVIYSVSWKDKAGSHVFIATETGMASGTDSTGNTGSSGHILGQHYIVGDTIRRTWVEGDSVLMCQLDSELGFLPSAFQLTDLDKDGIIELWLMHKSVCHGDVSPAEMQLVMHEGDQRFTMIGQSKVVLGESQSLGGKYDFNNLFLEGNPAFKKRGMDMWNDHIRGY